MKEYEVRVYEEDVVVEAIAHHITQECFLQLTTNDGVVACFKEWVYFKIVT